MPVPSGDFRSGIDSAFGGDRGCSLPLQQPAEHPEEEAPNSLKRKRGFDRIDDYYEIIMLTFRSVRVSIQSSAVG
jgi:hypothetical protein